MSSGKRTKSDKKRGRPRGGGKKGTRYDELRVSVSNFINLMKTNAEEGKEPLYLTHFLTENSLGRMWWNREMKRSPEFRDIVDPLLTHLEHYFLLKAMQLSGNFLDTIDPDGTKHYTRQGFNAGFVKIYAQNTFDYKEKVENSSPNDDALAGLPDGKAKKYIEYVLDRM